MRSRWDLNLHPFYCGKTCLTMVLPLELIKQSTDFCFIFFINSCKMTAIKATEIKTKEVVVKKKN